MSIGTLVHNRIGPIFKKIQLLKRMLACGVFPTTRHRLRRKLAAQYLQGDGIEIGGLLLPTPVPENVSVRYVDMLSMEEQRIRIPELAGIVLAVPDIIDDAETLTSIPDQSIDFIIANHVLEHFENPCGAIRTHLRKLRPKGIFFYAIPDKRLTFDHKRPLTEFPHLVRDDQLGVAQSSYEHYYEFTKLTSDLTKEDIHAEAQRLMGIDYRIHFHVWNNKSYKDFLERLNVYLGNPFSILHISQNGAEVIDILQKIAEPSLQKTA